MSNVRRLPIMVYQGKSYFIDNRLGQIRNIDNPSDYINIKDLPMDAQDAIEVVV